MTARLTLFMWLGIAFVIASIVPITLRGDRSRRAVWFTGLAAGCALLFPSTSFPSFSLPVPTFFTNPALTKALPSGRVVYVAPFPREQESNIAPMLWQAETKMRFDMPGGYVYVPASGGALESMVSSVDPLSAALLDIQAGGPPPPPSSFPALRGTLRKDHAVAVLVGPMTGEQTATRFFTDMLDTAPESMGGVKLWRVGEGLPARETTGG